MKCSGCVCDLKSDGINTVVAVHIDVSGDHKARAAVEKAFGDNKFSFCYVCWLKSLGAKK